MTTPDTRSEAANSQGARAYSRRATGDAQLATDDAERATDDAQRATGEAEPTWRRAHLELVRIANARAELDSDEGRWLLVAAREGTHARLGYASFVEYIERLFGYSPRFTLERLRVAEALERLPRTAMALSDGSLTWSATRELTRVAVPETEDDWLAAANGRTARDVEQLVSGHAPGSLPDDPPDETLRKHVIRLEVSGETLAAFREAMAKLRRDAGAPLDNDAAVLMLARHVLGGPAEEGRASYQVSLSVCERCRRGFQSGKGTVVEVDASVVEMASCDSQSLGPVDNSAHVGGMNAAVSAGDDGVPEEGSGERGGGSVAGALEEGDGASDEGDGSSEREPLRETPVKRRRVVSRATQSIPPAIRRYVLNRDERRCRVPGCRHGVFLDVHHIETRGEGGGNEAANLLTLCGAHHRAVHRGEVRVETEAAGELVFRHADGTPYGAPRVSARLIDARATAFRALRSLGYRETESRMALQRAMERADSATTAEMLLRRALRTLADAA